MYRTEKQTELAAGVDEVLIPGMKLPLGTGVRVESHRTSAVLDAVLACALRCTVRPCTCDHHLRSPRLRAWWPQQGVPGRGVQRPGR